MTRINNGIKQLQKKEKMWNKLFMASPTWIVLITLEDGKFIDINDAGCRDMGYAKEDIVGRTSVEIGLWHDEDERNHYLALIKKNGAIDKMPVKLTMRDGVLRDYLWSSTIITVKGEKCLLSVLVDVFELKKTEIELDKTNKVLNRRSNKLSEMNVALKVLLNQRDEDKEQLEAKVWHNIKKMIQPHLRNLKATDLNPLQHAHLDVVINRLDEITSGIGEKMGPNAYALSSRELEVAGHIIVGKANKEIAEILCISVHSVESHRFSIRKKLGILGKRSNLRTHLLNLSRHIGHKKSADIKGWG
ncbi:PAS domain S-box protein [Desulfotignum balticum]|uniref:PAS domain S-box protein n=1 Tax=Desulfotignum balticum TaxID=115781 RepID=UPI00146BB43F|nr:PAS domain S-box protein [Desulfotignum balticum]